MRPQRTFEGSRRRTTRERLESISFGWTARGVVGAVFTNPAAGSEVRGVRPRCGWVRRDQSDILNPLRKGSGPSDRTCDHILKGLILAQNERWRRGLGMQVGRAARPVA